MSGCACLVFEVPGLPISKGRHRSFTDKKKGVVVHVADRKTESYEAQVKWFARQAMGTHGLRDLLDGPLWMQVTAYKLPNKQQQKAMEREPNKIHYCTVKPDFDNLGKVIADALNGVAYRDDAIVADGRVVKRLDSRPRVVVSIGRLTD